MYKNVGDVSSSYSIKCLVFLGLDKSLVLQSQCCSDEPQGNRDGCQGMIQSDIPRCQCTKDN